jgi:hypothetical protein
MKRTLIHLAVLAVCYGYRQQLPLTFGVVDATRVDAGELSSFTP